MLRSVDGWEGEHFAFGEADASTADVPTSVAIDNGADGPSATIPDAHLLFTAQFSRAGTDLVLQGEDGKVVVVQDYFAADQRARLLSPDGAALSPQIVEALAGPLAPGQFAQAAATPPAVQAVGRVAVVTGDATIVRNGVAMAANAGDAILKGDVLQTVSGTIGVTFSDGSTLNLTANTRLVVNEFVYDPRGSANSQLLDLVQGSLTFISGEIAHNGDMRIGTPVATMGIRGTVGGVTTANDGTVNFYVSQSATGAVIINQQGQIIANVVQDGPLIIVRPVGPLQVIAEEVQKSPAQLATELAALQQIVNIQSVGQQIIQQFFQQDPNNQNPNPNPQSTDKPLTQIQTYEITLKPAPPEPGNSNADARPFVSATVASTTPIREETTVISTEVPIPPNLTPLNFGPLQQVASEDTALVFSTANGNALSVFDDGTGILTVTLKAAHGTLSLNGTAGLTFGGGGGTDDATMSFSGSQAAINAALDGMTFKPDADYTGSASISLTTGDGNSTSGETVVAVTVGAVNDAPVLDLDATKPGIDYKTTATTRGDAVSVFGDIAISDVDNATLRSASINLRGGGEYTDYPNDHMYLDISALPDGATGDGYNGALGGLSWSSTNGGGGLSMVITGEATVAEYQQLLAALRFSSTSGDTTDRTVEITVNDGEIDSAVATSTIHIDNFVQWNSTSGGDWFEDSSNWASQPHVPGTDDSADDVSITLPIGETITLNQSAFIHDLVVGAGVTLSVNSEFNLFFEEGPGLYAEWPEGLYVDGKTTNEGSILADGGNIQFIGDVVNTGAITAENSGEIGFYGDVTGAGILTSRDRGYLYFAATFAGAVVLSGGDAEFGSAVAADSTVTFEGSGSALWLNDASLFAGQISGFGLGDLIDFGGFADPERLAFIYDPEADELVVTYAADSEIPPVEIHVGISGDYSARDFAFLPDGEGGNILTFTNFWVGDFGADIMDPSNWSLNHVPDANTSVTFDSLVPTFLDLGGGDVQIAGLILGADSNLMIVNGSIDIGALDNSGTLTIEGGRTSTEISLHAVINQDNGTIFVNGDGADFYIYGGFDNFGTFEANYGATVYAYGDITNEAGGIFNVLNGATLEMYGEFTNHGTALVDPPAVVTLFNLYGDLVNDGEDASFTVTGVDGRANIYGDVYNYAAIEVADGGYFNAADSVEGSGAFRILGGTMEFGGAVACDVTVSFGVCTSDMLILGDSSKFGGTLAGFGAGDKIIDGDGVVANSFWVSNTDDGVVLHYTECGREVSVGLSGDYSLTDFAVTYGDNGGIQIGYNHAPVATPISESVSEDGEPVTIDALSAATDPDAGDALHIDPQSVEVSFEDGVDVDYSVDGNSVTIDPAQFDYLAAGESVVLSATYDIVDQSGARVETSATLTVTGVNDAPSISGVSSTGGILSTGLTPTAAGYLTAGCDLINGLGGDSGFGENNLSRNDDQSTGQINITSVFGDSGLNFFGHSYTSLYVNNNGNVTFGGASGSYTPQAITAGSLAIIAPFWADVDTNGGATSAGTGGHSTGSNLVYYDLDEVNHVMTITWDDVGYYSGHTNLANAFQLQLIGTGEGNFDIVMRYESINWTAGDASGGSGGLGGTTARAGYSAGDGIASHYYELPQSGNQSAMLALESTVGNSDIAGVDVFEVRSGSVSAPATVSGAIEFSDADASDTFGATVLAGGDNYIGTFILDDVTEADGGGSAAWRFSLTGTQTDDILSNGAATQSYNVTIADSHNASVVQKVSISFGSNADDTFNFNFATHLGADTILNFDTSEDTIVLEGYGAINDMEDLLAALGSNGVDADHGDAVINLGNGDSITVAGVTQSYMAQHLDLVHFGSGVQA